MHRRRLLLEVIAKTSKNISSSSSSSSDTSDDELHIVSHKKRTKIINYVENIVRNYSLTVFKEHFRISRDVAESLTSRYAGVKKKDYRGGWPQVSFEKIVLMTLWYLANRETFRGVADRFGVSISTAHVVIEDFTKYLNNCSNDYIKWPTQNEAIAISSDFSKKQGIIHVLGAIDGCHFKIRKPVLHANDYINRKGYASVILQAVVDNNKMFRDISVGAPGSVHDARALRKSKLYSIAESHNIFYDDYFLLGDSAYPLMKWLVPPFKDNGLLTEKQVTFNMKHSSTRIVVEHAFGLLKGRFRRLHEFENANTNLIVQYIIAACVLHNICILYNNDDLQFHTEHVNKPQEHLEDDTMEDNQIPAVNRRQEIFDALFNN